MQQTILTPTSLVAQHFTNGCILRTVLGLIIVVVIGAVFLWGTIALQNKAVKKLVAVCWSVSLAWTWQAIFSDNCGGKQELGYCSPAQLPYL